jgi:adenylate cyclase
MGDVGAAPKAAHAGITPSPRDTPRDRAGSMTWTSAISNRLAGLPSPIQKAIVLSVFLFLINVFTGMNRIWFHWPALSILFVATVSLWFRRNPGPEREDNRRTDRN